MLYRLLLLLVLIPLLEMLILIQIGRIFGFWHTLMLLIILGLVGAAMVRSQGFSVICRLRQEIARGQVPGLSLLDGMMVLTGGILLITPGLLTDLAGLMLLIPFIRRRARGMLLAWFWRFMKKRTVRLL
ncbi:MAG: phage T7 F exclusion suppressor FxsA [Pelotomaculum sp. PtaU1.Bin035]|nr:MAG: phage T7 F exclusion suppressor FxsA [Pelotomaculum sp. PtaU1.Bin035]